MSRGLRLRPAVGRTLLLLAAAVFILATLTGVVGAGLAQPRKWSRDIWIEGLQPGPANRFLTPPYGLMTLVVPFHEDGTEEGPHLFVLGSDGGGRDMLGLLARGALPSFTMVAAVVFARTVIGVLAGFAMASERTAVRVASEVFSRWTGGFPYLALAVVLVQAVSPRPDERTVWAFVLAMAAVGWREVAEVTRRTVDEVRIQPYTEAARALGSEGWTYLRRHVLPHLRPVLAVELPFQASSVLVLLGELGFLQVYLGGRAIPFVVDSSNRPGPVAISYRLLTSPELGQLLSDARNYILKEQWLPVMMPALTLALAALAFELIGHAVRMREAQRQW